MLVLLKVTTFDEGHIRILEDWSFRSRLVDFSHRNLLPIRYKCLK
jgi:hypothetical protein